MPDVNTEAKTEVDKDYVIKGIRLHIVEIAPIKKRKGGYRFLIGYRLIDGGFISPVAHFWFDFPINFLEVKNEDIIREVEKIIKAKAKEVIDFYLKIKGRVKIVE